ncbi:MAG: glycosyltransferase family 2 protein [Aquificae bacterium]|nr:glycosyltransferase family 2 protein [Aquificota bacterium]
MLTVLIRTRNEKENLPRVINSVRSLADEILVLDDRSTDGTPELARRLGARVVTDEEGLPLGEKVNLGARLAKNEWVLLLDADEELSPALREAIRRELKNPRYEAYELARKTYYLGAFLNHAWFPEWRLRLFKKGKVLFGGTVHEGPVRVEGRVGRLEGELYHYSFKSLTHQYEKLVSYARLQARVMYSKRKKTRWYHLTVNPLWSFFKTFVLKRGFLDGWRGFLVSVSGAVYTFLKYAFLKELELKEKLGKELWRR